MTNASVLDASVALSWVLPDERTAQSLQLRKRAKENQTFSLIVPPMFWYEVANVLWVAVRRQRLPQETALDALKALEDFHIDSWVVEPLRCLRLAMNNDLAVYDSSYLAIAQDLQIPLWTNDLQLASRARNLGIQVEPV